MLYVTILPLLIIGVNSIASEVVYVADSTPEVEILPIEVRVVQISTTTDVQVPSTKEEQIIQLIEEMFPEAPIMIDIARCESSFNPLADRGNLNVDVGLFQINQVHLPRLQELGLDRRDIHDNLQFARMLYDESGTSPWYMSEHCWGK